jgi:hypothetical protein
LQSEPWCDCVRAGDAALQLLTFAQTQPGYQAR